MQRMRTAKSYIFTMIMELFVTLLMIFSARSQLAYNKRPLENWSFWLTIIVGVCAFGAFVWALASYMRARKREQSR